jgi:hypothetical protein
METLNAKAKDEIRNQIPHHYLIKCGNDYGVVQIEVIWVDNQGEVTVDGAIWGPSGRIVCTFTNSKISPNWIEDTYSFRKAK